MKFEVNRCSLCGALYFGTKAKPKIKGIPKIDSIRMGEDKIYPLCKRCGGNVAMMTVLIDNIMRKEENNDRAAEEGSVL